MSHLVMLCLLATVAWGADRGYFGLSIAVDADGSFLNPALKSVTVENVTPNSPAAKAGLVAGDRIVEIEGHPVAGTKADVVKPYLERMVGQTTQMVVKKAHGEIVSVTLVAVSKVNAE
jgi:S1-C subfamily serine protease